MNPIAHDSTAEADPGPRLTEHLGQLRRRALLAGAAGAAVSVVAALIGPRGFYPAYLVAYLFWLGLALGSLAVIMLHHLVGGRWGFVVRRPAEAGAMTLPLMALLFLPIVAGMHTLYPWTDLELVRHDPALLHKSKYLNVNFFLVRTAIYFAIWSLMAVFLYMQSGRQDRTEDDGPTRFRQVLSGPGLAIWFLAVTFAMIDWVMSIEPHWYSSIYAVLILVGMVLATLALLVNVAARIGTDGPLARVADAEGFHELGNLMLAFTMLWAYMSFSQYLIIWIGNLKEEIPWYLRRSRDGWWYVALGLIFLHFFLPFFLLLFRDRKRSPRALAQVGALLLAVQFVNMVWLVLPAFPAQSIAAFWGVIPAWIGIGGLWVAAFAWLLNGRPLLPRNDPLLAEVFEHEHEHEHEGVH